MISDKDYVTPKSGMIVEIREGIFDLKEVYRAMHDWYEENKYNVQENKHVDKDLATGHEQTIRWECYRLITDYTKFFINVEFFVTDLRKVKVGDRELDKGNMTIKFFGYQELDYKKKWRSKPLGNFLMHVYNNYVLKKQIIFYRFKIYKELSDLHETAKKVLDMYD